MVVDLTDLGAPPGLVDQLSRGLTAPLVACRLDPERTAGREYYRDVCFRISIDTGDELVELGDGGSVDWTEVLLSDAKERLVIGGVSVDRLLTVNASL